MNNLYLNFRNEADQDIISFPDIIGHVQYDLGLNSEDDVRLNSLQVVRGLMVESVYPGDIDGITVRFWPGTPDDILQRIENEWRA